jgi:hypothetical protein
MTLKIENLEKATNPESVNVEDLLYSPDRSLSDFLVKKAAMEQTSYQGWTERDISFSTTSSAEPPTGQFFAGTDSIPQPVVYAEAEDIQRERDAKLYEEQRMMYDELHKFTSPNKFVSPKVKPSRHPEEGSRYAVYTPTFIDGIISTEKEELLHPHRPEEKDNYKIDYNNFKVFLDSYLSTDNDKYLFHFLVKSGIVNRSNPWCSFHKRGISQEEIDGYIKSKIGSDSKRMLGDVKVICSTIDLTAKLRKKISDIIDRLYRTNPENIFYGYIDNSDVYTEIIEEFTNRGIDIDEELLKPIDFRELRNRNSSIQVFYSEVFNELIYIPETYVPMHAKLAKRPILKDILSNKPIILKSSNSLKGFETININGIDYKKSIFESMVEANTDGFLLNLKIESMMDEQSAIESKNLELL